MSAPTTTIFLSRWIVIPWANSDLPKSVITFPPPPKLGSRSPAAPRASEEKTRPAARSVSSPTLHRRAGRGACFGLDIELLSLGPDPTRGASARAHGRLVEAREKVVDDELILAMTSPKQAVQVHVRDAPGDLRDGAR